MSSSKRLGTVRLLVRLAVFALVFVCLAEGWFRVVMPASEVPDRYQRDPSTIYRFDPTRQTNGVATVGRLCRLGGEWHVNSAGWNSMVEYFPARQRNRPAIALFGDSYVEAYHVGVKQHVDTYLSELMPGVATYAFGSGGWYLEQYVAASRYAQARFQPDVAVVLIYRKDVLNSLRENGVQSPYLWQIDPSGRSFKELPPLSAYTLSPKLVMAKQSALFRYLRYNADLPLPGENSPSDAIRPASGPVSNDEAASDAPPADTRLVSRAADYMVDQFCAANPGVPVIFAVHDHKDSRYLSPDALAATPLYPEAEAIRRAVERHPKQCSFVDLRAAFVTDWKANGVRFEAADDLHWNAYANRLVANSLAAELTRRHLLPSSDQSQ